MDDEYNKKIKSLTDKVRRIHKPKDTDNTMELSKVPKENLESYSSDQKNPTNIKTIAKKYVKYTYGIIPIIAIVLYISRPKFLMKKTKDKKLQFDLTKFIIVLVFITVLVFGVNFALSKFI